MSGHVAAASGTGKRLFGFVENVPHMMTFQSADPETRMPRFS